jgi:hypothetical protein
MLRDIRSSEDVQVLFMKFLIKINTGRRIGRIQYLALQLVGDILYVNVT